MEHLKRTPLFSLYEESGGKVIDFGGWALPVQFQGILDEHQAVREKAGLFDVSHMGELIVFGKDAEEFLQYLCTNDIAKLNINQAMYTFFCYPSGGVVDDLLVYKLAEYEYLLVVNAANTLKDYQWVTQQLQTGLRQVEVKNISEEMAQLAIQGPLAEQVLQTITAYPLASIKRFRFAQNVDVCGVDSLISRTGYTGEDGFEIYCKVEDAQLLWKAILEAGRESGVVPVGLGARDTLRFEACLPLYGQELSEHISPLEANLGFFVKLGKESNFIGKQALLEQQEQGVPRKLVGFEMIDRGVPRSHYEVYCHQHKIGEVTTGTFSPTLKKNIGLALIDRTHTDIGNIIEISIRGKHLKAEIIATPFLTKQ